MSNKAHSKLSPTDRIIRDTIAATKETSWGEDGTLVTIEFVSGFEKFNTRPYHNYETWGDGYRIKGRGVSVEREDLDEAIAAWALAVWEKWTTPEVAQISGGGHSQMTVDDCVALAEGRADK